MNDYVLFFDEVDVSRIQQVGGKGANLGELCKAGFPVPEGFCITTRAYLDFIQSGREMDSLLDELNCLNPDDLDGLREMGRRIRDHLTRLEIPGEIKNAVTKAWESTARAYPKMLGLFVYGPRHFLPDQKRI
jgi:phosphoenolpyruvate synthase/pyruvate phosphate dikinase